MLLREVYSNIYEKIQSKIKIFLQTYYLTKKNQYKVKYFIYFIPQDMLLRKLKPILSRSMALQKRFHWNFSNSTEDQMKIKSFDEGNAELSYCIMSMIRGKQNLEKLPQISLVEQILKMIRSKQFISEESKQQISTLFTTGININEDKFIFTQTRIKKGQISISLPRTETNLLQQKKTQKQRSQISSSGTTIKTMPKSKTLFVFHPTYMVTSQIFQKIINISDGEGIIIGHYGISKTVSVFLFWKLSQYIDKYRFNPSNNVQIQYFSIPKVFYYTIEMDDTLEDIQNKLLKQTDFQYLKTCQNKSINLKKQYEKYRRFHQEFRVNWVCDNINKYFSIGRKVVFLQEKINRKVEDENQLTLKKQQLKDINKNFQSIVSQFDGILYLSSMLIDSKTIKKLNLSKDGSQEEIEIQDQIFYSSQIFKDQNMYDLSDYFIFEFEKRVFGQKNEQLLNEIQKKQLRKKCYQYLKEKKEDYFFIPRDLRKKINSKKLRHFQQLKQKESEQSKLDFIFEQFKNIVSQSTQQYGKILRKSLIKQEQNEQNKFRLTLLFKIYNLMFEINQDLKKKGHKIYPQEIDISKLQWSMQQLNEFLDKRIFQLSNIYNLKLQLPFPLILKTLSNQITKNINIFMDDYSRLFKKCSKERLGKQAEKFFFLALLTGNTDFKIITPSDTVKQFKSIHKNCYWFKSIPPINKNKLIQQINKKNAQKKQDMSENKVESSQNNCQKQNISSNLSQQMKEQKSRKKVDKHKEKRGVPSQDEKKIFDKKRQQREKIVLQQETLYRRKNKFQFLKSFTQNIKEMYSKNHRVALFLPTVLSRQKIKEKSFQQITQIINKNSMCIDGILTAFTDAQDESVELWAFDLTVGKDSAKQKLKNFITQFIAFQDRLTNEITIKLSKKHPRKFKTYLYYFILDYTGLNTNIQDQLNNQFGDFIKFKSISSSNSWYQVTQIDGKKQGLLKKIGVLNYDDNIKFMNPTEDMALTFQEVISESKKMDKKLLQQKKAKQDQYNEEQVKQSVDQKVQQ